jgi:signal peptidase I
MRFHRTRADNDTGSTAPSQGLFRARLQPETRQGYILLCMALWSVISFLIVSNFIVSTVTVSGVSMVPTLYPGQVYLLNRWSTRLFPPNYGDLVVVRDRSSGELLVKRIVALPNDSIEFRQGRVLLNGRALREPYLPPGSHTASRKIGATPQQLAHDEFFVMGDNRMVSEDSRSHGPVRRADILGTITP